MGPASNGTGLYAENGTGLYAENGTGLYADNGTGLYAENGTGLYAEISSDLVFHVNEDISFHADAYGHIWIDGDGPELTASADISLNIPKDAFATLIPPCGLSLAAGVAIGRFSHGSDTVRGIKGYFDADICDLFSLSENVFIDSSGGVHVGSAGDYTLIDAGNGTAYLLARLSDGQVAIRRVRVLAKPLAPAQVVVPVVVKPGQTATDFVLSWRRGAPSITLTAPDGTTYTPQQIGAGNTVYTARPSDLSPGFVGSEALYLRRLPAGLWHVTIGNLRGDEGYRLLVQGKPPPAALTVDAPAAGQTLTADPSATLSGTLAGDGTGASAGPQTVSLYYTTVIDGHTLPNYAGTQIATGVPVRDGAWSYAWDTSALPAGPYYVYATLDNGTGPEVNGYATGAARVVQAARPDAPRDVVATQSGRQLSLLWSAPARAGIVTGYKLHWRTDAMPAGQSYTLDLGEAHSYILNEAQTGVTYQATVSDYDLSGHESAASPAQLTAATPSAGTAPQQPADFSLATGRGTLRAGGFVTIPLALRPATGATATHGPADYVALSVSAPTGVLARTSAEDLNLFAPGSGALAPTLRVFTSRTLRPGTYPIVVTARQAMSGRTRMARATLTVTAGEASVVSMEAGRPTRRPDGLLSVAIVARVTDDAGAPVRDGSGLSFTTLDGALLPAAATTTGGVARTTLVYAPGTHPVVTADALSALGTFYLGPTPRGSSRLRLFAATAGQAPYTLRRTVRVRVKAGHTRTVTITSTIPAVDEDLALRNPLALVSHVRVTLATTPRGGGAVQQQTLTVVLGPHASAVKHLSVLTFGRPLVGVTVRSDTPVYSQRIVNRAASSRHGRGHALGTSSGVVAPRTGDTLALPASGAMVDLFNPGTVTAPVRLSVSLRGMGKGTGARAIGTTSVTLKAGAANQVDLAGLIASRLHESKARGPIVVRITAAQPVVAEADPAPSPPAPARPAPRRPAGPVPAYCIGIRGPLTTYGHRVTHR